MLSIEILAKNIINLDLDEIAFRVFNMPEVKRLIIDLNTQKQLFDKGIDSTGRRLDDIGGGYAPFTIEEKIRKGQPTDRVTLKDTGDFYDSFTVTPAKGFFVIDSDPVKEFGTNLNDEWGGNLEGLTDNSRKILKNEITPFVIAEIRAEICKGI